MNLQTFWIASFFIAIAGVVQHRVQGVYIGTFWVVAGHIAPGAKGDHHAAHRSARVGFAFFGGGIQFAFFAVIGPCCWRHRDRLGQFCATAAIHGRTLCGEQGSTVKSHFPFAGVVIGQVKLPHIALVVASVGNVRAVIAVQIDQAGGAQAVVIGLASAGHVHGGGNRQQLFIAIQVLHQ